MGQRFRVDLKRFGHEATAFAGEFDRLPGLAHQALAAHAVEHLGAADQHRRINAERPADNAEDQHGAQSDAPGADAPAAACSSLAHDGKTKALGFAHEGFVALAIAVPLTRGQTLLPLARGMGWIAGRVGALFGRRSSLYRNVTGS